jgi:vacuolar-type H+-ATPase subunit C/Vma6
MPTWDDVNARTRGLAGHLLSASTLESLASVLDLPALARRLRELGIEPAGDESPRGLELAVRRAVAHRVGLLARWLGERTAVLSVIFEDEDRRSVRALLRGAATAAPPTQRLAGLLPTPSLPERVLEELAHQSSPRDVAKLLTVWRHPFGGALLVAAGTASPDLFVVEHALNRIFATRAVAGAARGGAVLRAYVADLIDLANGLTAIAIAGAPVERSIEALFLPGGHRLGLERYVEAAKDRQQAVAIVAGALQGSRAALLRRHGREPGALERALVHDAIESLRRAARLDPLGPAVLIGYFLRLRAQTMALRSAIWGLALGAPAAVRQGRLPQPA